MFRYLFISSAKEVMCSVAGTCVFVTSDNSSLNVWITAGEQAAGEQLVQSLLRCNCSETNTKLLFE